MTIIEKNGVMLATLNKTKSPFVYNQTAFGGTEYMGRGFEKHIAPYMPKLENYVCGMAPGMLNPDAILNATKPTIFWLHNTPIQFGPEFPKFLSLPEVQDNLAYVVTVSESAKQEIIDQTITPADKVYVIPNAIDSLTYNPDKFTNIEKIRLINTSSPDRGMEVLLLAIEMLDKDLDFEIDVFSKFHPWEAQRYEVDPRINFYGFSYRDTVKKHGELAHIHAYPSTYPETFCLSQAEAMSGGLLCVTSNIGALPEISNGFTDIYPYTDNVESHAKIFAERITKAIETIKDGKWDPSAQIEYVNKTYSWETIKNKWLEFHELL